MDAEWFNFRFLRGINNEPRLVSVDVDACEGFVTGSDDDDAALVLAAAGFGFISIADADVDVTTTDAPAAFTVTFWLSPLTTF